MNSLYFINLLRGLAAFWVLVAHCVIWSGYSGLVVPSPKLAVDLFMIISGFLMTRIASTKNQNASGSFSKPIGIFSFYGNRYFRIAPAYYLSLGLAVLLESSFLDGYQVLRMSNIAFWADKSTYDPGLIDYSIWNLLVHATFVFGAIPEYSFSTFLPDWSLSLEMQFYLFFPFIFLATQKFGLKKTVVVLGTISIIFALTWYVAAKTKNLPPALIFPEPSFLLLKLPYFLCGIVIHSWLDTRDQVQRKSLFVLALLLVCWELSYRMSLLWLPTLALIFMGLATWERQEDFGQSMPGRLMQSRLVELMSDCSYSVYLFHGFFISLFGSFLINTGYTLTSTPIFFIFVSLVILSAYLAAYLIHRFVEKSGIRLGRRLATAGPHTATSR
jgi:peptidoglycan/LPS O-acetylase OafA/YrhL